MEPTRVYITVDVECAEERPSRGGVLPAIEPALRVFGRFENSRRELGIGLIMDELETAGLRGTFFVEALSSHYFGKAALAEACAAVRGRGHDVQLHLHPVLRQPNWLSRGTAAVEDNIGAYAEQEQVALLQEGLDLLAEAGVARGDLLAFRAGTYGIDNRSWSAMAAVGIAVSSSFNLMYMGITCQAHWPRPEIELFDTGAGVLELPVSAFREGSNYRHLQITAISATEMEDFLRRARRAGIREITIVMHSFEFFYLDSVAKRRGRENRINVARLRSLCAFLAAHPEEFEVETMLDLSRRAKAGDRSCAVRERHDVPHGSPRRRLRRLVEQAYKRAEARYPTLQRIPI
jgi:hypothetical protein